MVDYETNLSFLIPLSSFFDTMSQGRLVKLEKETVLLGIAIERRSHMRVWLLRYQMVEVTDTLER